MLEPDPLTASVEWVCMVDSNDHSKKVFGVKIDPSKGDVGLITAAFQGLENWHTKNCRVACEVGVLSTRACAARRKHSMYPLRVEDPQHCTIPIPALFPGRIRV
jgi:hypothetical protein